MKKCTEIILFTILVLSLIGCKTRYVPIETIQTEKEFVDRWQRDSVYLHDSIWIEKKGDTLWMEKYKTVYKEVVKRDSVFITDSVRVQVPYPVVEVQEVNRLHHWQIVLMCLGGVLIGLLAYRLLRWWKK